MAPYIQTDRAPSAYAGTDLPDKPKQSPKLTALPFTALGALPRDVLYGSRGTGVFLPDHKLAFSTRTASGVSLTGTAIRQGDRVAASVTGTHTLAALNNSTVTALATSSGLLGLDLTTKVAPGLITTTSASIAPGPLSKKGLTGKLGWEYANEFVHIKGSTSAEPQPLINVAFASGYGELQLGADLTYSTARALECARAARSQAARNIQETSPSSAQAAPGSGATVPGVTGVVTPSVAVGSPGPGVGPTATNKPAPTGGQLLSEGAYKNSAFSAAALVGGLTQWTAALGWKHEVHQVALSVSDSGTQPLVLAAKLSYAVTVQDGITFAAEAARDLPMQAKDRQFTPPVVFSVGVAANVSALRRAADTPWDQQGSNSNGHLMKPASGTSPLVKVKLDSDGTVSALYSDTLLTGAQGSGIPTLQATWTAQMNAKDPFGRMPRIGVAAELV